MRSRSTLELGGRTVTGIEVPTEVVEALGAGRGARAVVRIGGCTYRSTVASMGGRSLLPVSAEHRAGAGVSAGDELDVELELDTQPREVAVPDDLAAALAARLAAQAAFDQLSSSGRRRLVLAVDAARAPATRERRIASTLSGLLPS